MLNAMAPDDRTTLLDELPATVTQQLLNLLSPQERAVATQLLGYPAGSVGRLMTPEYMRVRPESTIAAATGATVRPSITFLSSTMEALDEPYLQIAFGRMVRKRADWLVILFLSEMLIATAMGFFEEEIARAVVLALFVPLISSSGGNSGS